MTSTERMERKSRKGRNWMAVIGISKEQFDETVTNSCKECAQGKPKWVKDSFRSKENSGLLALTISF